MDPAQYEAHLWGQMIKTMGLLIITYLPLQIGAILVVRHWAARLAAGLPIILMLPVTFRGFNTNTYQDGSLFGIGLLVVTVPVIFYLAVFLLAGLSIRSANAKKSDQGETTSRNGNGLALSLLTLAAIVLIAVLFMLTPR
jgi:hypothetical protein